ncbi:unnamed protein product, partial [Nesidiocoris tenuis]
MIPGLFVALILASYLSGQVCLRLGLPQVVPMYLIGSGFRTFGIYDDFVNWTVFANLRYLAVTVILVKSGLAMNIDVAKNYKSQVRCLISIAIHYTCGFSYREIAFLTISGIPKATVQSFCFIVSLTSCLTMSLIFSFIVSLTSSSIMSLSFCFIVCSNPCLTEKNDLHVVYASRLCDRHSDFDDLGVTTTWSLTWEDVATHLSKPFEISDQRHEKRDSEKATSNHDALSSAEDPLALTPRSRISTSGLKTTIHSPCHVPDVKGFIHVELSIHTNANRLMHIISPFHRLRTGRDPLKVTAQRNTEKGCTAISLYLSRITTGTSNSTHVVFFPDLLRIAPNTPVSLRCSAFIRFLSAIPYRETRDATKPEDNPSHATYAPDCIKTRKIEATSKLGSHHGDEFSSFSLLYSPYLESPVAGMDDVLHDDGLLSKAKGGTHVFEKTLHSLLEGSSFVASSLIRMLETFDNIQFYSHSQSDESYVSCSYERNNTCKLQVKGEDVLVGTRSQGGGLYKLALKTVYPNHEPVDINSLTTRDTLQLYHERFGHQNKRHVRSILARELGINVKLDSELCEACMYGKSPMELWTGKKPSVKHLKIIGSECYVHVPKQQRTKLSKKAVKGVLVGYENTEGYRVWCKETNRILRSRDVIFDEKPLKSENKLLPERQTSKDFEVDEADKSETEDDSGNEDLEDSTDEIERVLRNRSTLKKPLRFEDLVMEAITGMNEYKEPQTYYQAVNSQNRTEWEEAMKSEMDSLAANKTWIMAKLPPGKKALRCRWVFRVKTNPDGSVDRYKARLVIKGFSQKKGIDYEETFSPVAKTGTIRCLLSVAANEDMVLGQFDVSTAFLYGDLEEEIFMVQPEGFEDGTNRVCHLKKSLYGLKQAPRCWNKRVVDYLKKIGFKASDADPCLFIRQNGTEKVLIALYVDDGLIAASSTKLKDEFLEEMRREFKITTKAASYFLGVEIVQEDGKITVNQAAYVRNILQKFGMENCKPVSTPMVKEDKAADQETKDTGVPEEGPKFPYRQAVGALMYLMVSTRPDIAFSVGVVSRSLENPTESDIVKVKRIFRYLRGTANYGLTYKRGQDSMRLIGYSDADHGGDGETGRSTSGVLCLYSGGAVSWLSQRQASVAISTTEAEIVAASEGAKELVWLKRLLESMVGRIETPQLEIDNEAALKLAKNPEYHRRTKHIRIRHFFVRELVIEEEIQVKKVDTNLQVADILTKALHQPRHRELCQRMGLNRKSGERACFRGRVIMRFHTRELATPPSNYSFAIFQRMSDQRAKKALS